MLGQHTCSNRALLLLNVRPPRVGLKLNHPSLGCSLHHRSFWSDLFLRLPCFDLHFMDLVEHQVPPPCQIGIGDGFLRQRTASKKRAPSTVVMTMDWVTEEGASA